MDGGDTWCPLSTDCHREQVPSDYDPSLNMMIIITIIIVTLIDTFCNANTVDYIHIQKFNCYSSINDAIDTNLTFFRLDQVNQ